MDVRSYTQFGLKVEHTSVESVKFVQSVKAHTNNLCKMGNSSGELSSSNLNLFKKYKIEMKSFNCSF